MADYADLVQLHLITPNHVEPLPGKENFGRFDKVLRSVGSPRTVHVRARMITVVADTKYKTTSGLPVSLVGLHGKDEMLVTGPVWALLKLAQGKRLEKKNAENTHDAYRRALRTVLEEAFWLLRVPELLALAQGGAWHDHSLRHCMHEARAPESVAYFLGEAQAQWLQMEAELAIDQSRIDAAGFATAFLQGMFRCTIDQVLLFFSEQSLSAFVRTAHDDCVRKHRALRAAAEKYGDVHCAWWAEWEPEAAGSVCLPDYLVESGRNVTAYATRAQSLHDPKPRRYSMHQKWKTTIEELQGPVGA